MMPITEKRRTQQREWNEKNKEKVLRMRKANYIRTKEQRKITLALKNRNRPLISFTISTVQRVIAFKAKAIENNLPYNNSEFMTHIESQFKEGMTWDNRGEWHIDHIQPVSYFTDKGIFDINIINALSNLQPLWPKDNLRKSKEITA